MHTNHCVQTDVGATQHLLGVEIPDTLQLLGVVGYLSVVTGVGLGSFMAWNKK